MMKPEQITHMKEQMHPSEELIAKVRTQVSDIAPEEKRTWIPRAAAAFAVMAVIAGAAWALPQIGLQGSNDRSSHVSDSAGGASGFTSSPEEGLTSAAGIENGVYIPKMVLEEPQPGVTVDMVGLIVYRGNIYTWTNNLSLSEERETALRGEYLGRTKGNLDEWSKQEDYAQEFASSIGAEDVYAVNGYDIDFRIMTSDRQGNVGIYERLNDFWLETGEDLFGEMKLKGRLKTICWQPLSQWDSGEENWREAELSKETADAFVEGLYNSSYLEKSDWRELGPKPCILTLTDGTEIRLMLLKGGYVKYLGMGGNGVFQMEESAFNGVYDALQ